MLSAPPIACGAVPHNCVTHKLVVAKAQANSSHVCSSFIGSREVDDVANKVYPALTKLRRLHPDAEIRISTNSLSAHHSMVLDGMGVAILPEFIVRDDLRKGRLVALLEDEIFRFNMKVATRVGEALTPAANIFLEHLKTVVNELLKPRAARR